MLTEDERAILQFEEDHPEQYAAKEQDIRRTFGISHVRYQQKLIELVMRPDAVAEFPQLAKLLQRRREKALAEREARLLRRHED
jgi:hypothetical protein